MLKRLILILPLLPTLLFAEALPDVNLSTEEKLNHIVNHDRAFQAHTERVRDPFVFRGPDNAFYMTGTTAGSHWGEIIGIRIWRSENLAEWEDLGFVWDLFKNAKPQNTWHFNQPVKRPDFKNPKAVWAPEIHFLNQTWWVPHCLNGGGHGLLKSKSGNIEGPYETLDRFGYPGIDGHLYQEPDGTTYYMYQADKLARMHDDMSGLAEPFVELEHDGNHPLGYEGILMLKMGNHYVWIASGRYGYEPTNTYDLYYAISDNIRGPYGKRRMAIKNAGHGNLFQDNAGRWWATAFDHEFTDDWTLWLVPLEIEVTADDVHFHVKDPRFQPTKEDHDFVKHLAKTGIPAKWESKSPWWRPEE